MKLAALALAVTAAAPLAAADNPTPIAGACALLTSPEAEAYFGRPLPTKHPRGTPNDSQCEWADKTLDRFLTVELFTKPGAAFDNPIVKKLLGPDAVELPGVGERAVRRADATAFVILAHGKLAIVSLADLGKPPDRSAHALAFAKTIAARL